MTRDVRDRLGIEQPIVQAGLGGGLARAELATAVSLAGGLGTVGILPDPRAFRTPAALVRGMDAALADVTPLYAGECVAKIRGLMSAAEVVREIASGRAV